MKFFLFKNKIKKKRKEMNYKQPCIYDDKIEEIVIKNLNHVAIMQDCIASSYHVDLMQRLHGRLVIHDVILIITVSRKNANPPPFLSFSITIYKTPPNFHSTLTPLPKDVYYLHAIASVSHWCGGSHHSFSSSQVQVTQFEPTTQRREYQRKLNLGCIRTMEYSITI